MSLFDNFIAKLKKLIPPPPPVQEQQPPVQQVIEIRPPSNDPVVNYYDSINKTNKEILDACRHGGIFSATIEHPEPPIIHNEHKHVHFHVEKEEDINHVKDVVKSTKDIKKTETFK